MIIMTKICKIKFSKTEKTSSLEAVKLKLIVINTTEGRELSMDVSARDLASTVNNFDVLDSPFQFFEAWLPGTAGRARFPAKIIPPSGHMTTLSHATGVPDVYRTLQTLVALFH